MKMYQQGDVLLKSIDVIPDGAKVVEPRDGLFVLAEGEVTGHKHAIEEIAGVRFLEKDGMFYIQNETPVKVRHEEHREITLPIGIWKVEGVREYDHFKEEARRVID